MNAVGLELGLKTKVGEIPQHSKPSVRGGTPHFANRKVVLGRTLNVLRHLGAVSNRMLRLLKKSDLFAQTAM